jgi:membrane protein
MWFAVFFVNNIFILVRRGVYMENKKSNLTIILVLFFILGSFGLCALFFVCEHAIDALSDFLKSSLNISFSRFLGFLFILFKSFATNKVYQHNMYYLDEYFANDIPSIKKSRMIMFYLYLILLSCVIALFVFSPYLNGSLGYIRYFFSISAVLISQMTLYLKRLSDNEYGYSVSSDSEDPFGNSKVSRAKIVFFIAIAAIYLFEAIFYFASFIFMGINEVIKLRGNS